MEDITFTRWKKDESPGLVGDQKEEWNNFFKGMVGSDFVINNSKYILLWSWDKKIGNANANLAYKFRMVELREVEPYFWYNELWNWQLPLKVELFVWIMLKQRILTWENLNKRGFSGTSRCILCGISEETMFHLFVECGFIKDIWQTISKDLNLVSPWEGFQMEDCFQKWLKKKDNGNEIPCFICWDVWKHINLVIFEDLSPNLVRVINCIL